MKISYLNETAGRYLAAPILASAILLYSPLWDKPMHEDIIRKRPEINSIRRYVNSLPVDARKRVFSWAERLVAKGFIESAWEEAAPYEGIDEMNAAKRDIHPKILTGLSMVESGPKGCKAVSRAKAKGRFQFIKSTGEEYGLSEDNYVNDFFDPEKASEAGSEYLGRLLKKYNHRYELALAGYNYGEGNLERNGIDERTDFWKLVSSKVPKQTYFWEISHPIIPDETYHHIPKVLAAALILEKPELFGIKLEKKNIEFKNHYTSRGESMWTLRRKLNTNPKELERFNPQIKNKNRIPPGAKIRFRHVQHRG